MDEFIGSFVEEAGELLIQLEDDLIGLEQNPANASIVHNIFRVMHTLKGSAGMVGFKNIQDLTHGFESIYEQIRSGHLAVTSEIIDLTLRGKDLMMTMLKKGTDSLDDNDLHLLKEQLNSLNAIPEIVTKQVKELQPDEYRRLVVFFMPDSGVFERGLNPDRALDELKLAGSAYIVAHTGDEPWEVQKQKMNCTTIWEIYLAGDLSASQVEEAFLFYEEDEYLIFEIPHDLQVPEPILVNQLARFYGAGSDPLIHIHNAFASAGEQVTIPAIAAAQPAETQLPSANTTDRARTETESTVSVSSGKLDELMNLVSELVTLTATLESHASLVQESKLANSVENLEKLTKKFRNIALDLRLVPVGSLLSKFKRQVRDLSRDLNKKVNLLIEGQDIEIDKTILKSIESPLQHIIRNSIDHGIESGESRIAKGKPGEGLLKITAFYSGASVIIQVQDDGSGINLERVHECASKMGWIEEGQVVSKEDLIGFIMEPGFTTSNSISMVSGRGVGMDVVKKELAAVGGSIEIFTEKDLGTSITMKLPTTLTIIDTLMVDVAESQVLIPVMDIEYCFRDSKSNLFNKDNRYIQYKSNPIPLVSLRDQFKYPEQEDEDLMVIVLNKFDRKYAVTADRIIGEHQAVIKPLGDLFMNQPYFSGGSIMVDGKLALILDTNFLFNQANKQ